MTPVIIDANVWVSAFLSPSGPPGQILEAARSGQLDPNACPTLIREVAEALSDPWIESKIPHEVGLAAIAELTSLVKLVEDPAQPAAATRDPKDDYIVALAIREHPTCIVSGDRDLLDYAQPPLPIVSPRAFLDALRSSS